MFKASGRRFLSIVAAVVLVVGLGALATGATAAPGSRAAALPVVTVSPNTGLVDLQKVTVSGAGFSANVTVASVECRPGATGEPDCDLSTVVYATTDQNGAFTQTRYVRRLITVGTTADPPTSIPIDCGARAGCILGVGNVANFSEANGDAIFFNPNVPPVVPTLIVTPHTNLADHQLVDVEGTGFAPESNVEVQQCVTQPLPDGFGLACDYATSRYLTVADDGTFSAAQFALERVQQAFTKTGNQTVDCATGPDVCDIEATTYGFGNPTTLHAPLTFNPALPLVSASAHASPANGLHDLDEITITGDGFTPGVAVNIQQCTNSTPSEYPACDYTHGRSVTAGFHGEFTLTFAVHRTIGIDEYPSGIVTTDCATTKCDLLAEGSSSQPAANIPISFNVNVHPATQVIGAGPSNNLHDNQQLTVLLRGFASNQPVEILECPADALNQGGDLNICDYTTAQLTGADGNGTSITTLRVHRTIGGQDGLTDCASRAGACVLIAVETPNYYYGGSAVATPAIAPNTPTTVVTAKPSAPSHPKAAPGSSVPGITYTTLSFSNR
jgi:hypothetical protein